MSRRSHLAIKAYPTKEKRGEGVGKRQKKGKKENEINYTLCGPPINEKEIRKQNKRNKREEKKEKERKKNKKTMK